MSEDREYPEDRGPWAYGPTQPDIVGETLAPLLGPDDQYIRLGLNDIRLFSVIDNADIPVLIYAKIMGRRSPFWKSVYDEFLHLKISTGGGRGRRDIIRMEGVSKGGSVDVKEEIPRPPGWMARNVTRRNWEEEQRREMERESQR